MGMTLQAFTPYYLGKYGIDALQEVFSLTRPQAENLFLPTGYTLRFDRISIKQVIRKIEGFLK